MNPKETFPEITLKYKSELKDNIHVSAFYENIDENNSIDNCNVKNFAIGKTDYQRHIFNCNNSVTDIKFIYFHIFLNNIPKNNVEICYLKI